MIDLERSKRNGIRQARATIYNLIRKRKLEGVKLNKEDNEVIAKQHAIIARWERTSSKGWKL